MTLLKTPPNPIRVVVVDDSPTATQLLVALLQSTEGIQVVGVGANGEDAVRLASRLRPNVLTMDVRMPKMDGLEATRRIMRETPTPIVIVTSSKMRGDVDLTFEALRAGALAIVNKPGLSDPETCNQVVQTVRNMANVPVVRRWDTEERRISQPRLASKSLPGDKSLLPTDGKDPLRIQLIGIASSTGGPGVLASILGALPRDFMLPILIVQHITAGFATGLAEWLDSVIPLRVILAGHGDVPRPGTVLLAPDDYHMQVNVRGVIELYKGQPYKGLRPSANYLFHSLARSYGARALGIILTGMGDDGAEGIQALYEAGGLTVAQDEPSCVVYGMPREAVARQAIDQVLTPDEISLLLNQLTQLRKETVTHEQQPENRNPR